MAQLVSLWIKKVFLVLIYLLPIFLFLNLVMCLFDARFFNDEHGMTYQDISFGAWVLLGGPALAIIWYRHYHNRVTAHSNRIAHVMWKIILGAYFSLTLISVLSIVAVLITLVYAGPLYFSS